MAIVRITLLLILAVVPTDVSASMPDWIGKLIVLQACVLERMALWEKEAALSKAAKIIQGGLRSRPHLLEVYLDVLAAEDKSGDNLIALGVVTDYCRALPSYSDGKSIRWPPSPTPKPPFHPSSALQRTCCLLRFH